MPQKMNKAGNMQNYVPAGNGDASGEYGDNATGSNKHFTSFVNPRENSGNTPNENPKKELKKEDTKYDKLTAKQKHSLEKLIPFMARRQYSDDEIITMLRRYTGDFGDLSAFTNKELIDIANLFKDKLGNTGSETYYIKKGGKWYTTKNPEYSELGGYKPLTEEQYHKLIADTNSNLITNSQQEEDKKIQKLFNDGGCVVCFGKGYKKEDLEAIYNAQQRLVSEYPELNGYIKLMGDRTNLEKYMNALNDTREFTEEEIKQKMDEIQSYNFMYMDESRLRTLAVEKLKNKVSFPVVNSAYAYWNPTNKAMIYMPKMKNVSQEQRDYEFNSNFKSSNSTLGTNYHEMGHAVHSLVNDLYTKANNNTRKKGDYKLVVELEQINTKFKNDLADLVNQNVNPNATEGQKKYNISRYGQTNTREFVAECFSAHYTDMNNSLATQTVNLFKQYLNDLRRFL